MPLTPAHPAAVLPLQRLGLPLSALVCGAVAPDVPVYLPVVVSYSRTHSWAGLPYAVVVGLVLLCLWSVLVRDAVADLVPPLRRRLPRQVRLHRRAWLLAPVAVAVGAATHVLWDAATHDWGFVVRELSVLRNQAGPLRVHEWLQHLSTAVGSAVVAAYAFRTLLPLPVTPRPPSAHRPWPWFTPVVLAALVVGIVRRDPEAAVGAAMVALLGVALLWRLRAGRT